MATGTYYAWSPITNGLDDRGQTAYVKIGDKVSAGDLDMDDDEFQVLIDARVVRSQPYPEALVNSPIPPSDYFKGLLAKAGEGELTEEETKELAGMSLGFDDSSSSKLALTDPEVEDVSGTTKTSTKASSTSTST